MGTGQRVYCHIYVCYEDDIFIATQSYDEINKLKQTIEKNSIQKLTTELNISKKNNPLQDVLFLIPATITN